MRTKSERLRSEWTIEQARQLVRQNTIELTPEQSEQVAQRMVARGECVWHALSRVVSCPCLCTPCRKARAAAHVIESQCYSVMMREPSRKAARRLILVRWITGMPSGWVRQWLAAEAKGMRLPVGSQAAEQKAVGLIRRAAEAELGRLSAGKLDERWTDRPAQKQVLSNVLHTLKGQGLAVTRAQRQQVAHTMQGKQLRELGTAVVSVVTAEALIQLDEAAERTLASTRYGSDLPCDVLLLQRLVGGEQAVEGAIAEYNRKDAEVTHELQQRILDGAAVETVGEECQVKP